MKQEYKNHRKYTPLYHFVLLPLLLISLIWFVYEACFTLGAEQKLWIALSVLTFLLSWTAVLMRQQYALKNQDRIIRLEMRLRYYRLTHKPFEVLEKRLTLQQLIALRFASDDELIDLLSKTIKEDLTPKEIKKSIQEWTPDYMRV